MQTSIITSEIDSARSTSKVSIHSVRSCLIEPQFASTVPRQSKIMTSKKATAQALAMPMSVHEIILNALPRKMRW